MRFESVAGCGGGGASHRSSFVQGKARLGGGRQVLEIGNLAKLLVRIVEPFLLWEAMILAILEPLALMMTKFFSFFQYRRKYLILTSGF